MIEPRGWKTISAFIILASSVLVTVHGTEALDPPSVPYDQPGPHEIIEFHDQIQDPSGERSVQISVALPALTVDAPPSPLIILNHGFLLSASGYHSYAVHLASHGFVVVLPTLQMSPLSMHHGELAQDVLLVVERCLEMSAQPDHPLFERLDPERIGVAGHSLGGKLSLLAALTDPRIRSAVLLDPVDAGSPFSQDSDRYPRLAPDRLPELEIPLLLIGAEYGGRSLLLTPCAPEDANYQRLFESANPPAVEITQLGAGHAQYVDPGTDRALVDLVCAIGVVPDEWVRTASAAYMTAHFAATLRGDVGSVEWLELRWMRDLEQGLIRIRRKPGPADS